MNRMNRHLAWQNVTMLFYLSVWWYRLFCWHSWCWYFALVGFFRRAFERRVLLKVVVCYTSSHVHIFITSSHLIIFTSSHLLIFTSSHLIIFTSSHLLISTSSHPHIFSASHLHIFSSSHLHIFSSPRLHIVTSSQLHFFTSSHFHIFASSHPYICTSSHIHILTSAHLRTSSPLSLSLSFLLPPVTVSLLLFLFTLKAAGSAHEAPRYGHSFARNEVRVSKTDGFLRVSLVLLKGLHVQVLVCKSVCMQTRLRLKCLCVKGSVTKRLCVKESVCKNVSM